MGAVAGKVLQTAVFCPPAPTPVNAPVEYIATPHGSQIPVVMLTNPKSNGITVLYSHGNAEDLGGNITFMSELRNAYDVNVFGYDYTGYGLSRSTDPDEKCPLPSEQKVLADAETAWKHLLLSIPPENIVLYGRSLGSGPACHLAALHAHRIRGLILVSPLLSCIQTQVNANLFKERDIFVNQALIPKLTCPVLVIHGTKDSVVPFSHGQYFEKHLPNKPQTVWVENAGHNDIMRIGSLSIRRGIAAFLRSTIAERSGDRSRSSSEHLRLSDRSSMSSLRSSFNGSPTPTPPNPTPLTASPHMTATSLAITTPATTITTTTTSTTTTTTTTTVNNVASAPATSSAT